MVEDRGQRDSVVIGNKGIERRLKGFYLMESDKSTTVDVYPLQKSTSRNPDLQTVPVSGHGALSLNGAEGLFPQLKCQPVNL